MGGRPEAPFAPPPDPPQRTSPRTLQKIPHRTTQKMMAPVSARSVDLSKVRVRILVPPMMTARHCSKSSKREGIATVLALPAWPPNPLPVCG